MVRILCLVLLIVSSSAQAKNLRIAGIEGGPHFLYDANSTRPGGLVPQFVDQYIAPALKAKYNMNIEWHQAPTARLLKELEVGDLDVLCFLIVTPGRQKTYAFAKEPFISGHPSMIVRKGFVKGNEISDYSAFKNKMISMMAGVHIPPFIEENKITLYPLTGYNFSDRTLSLLANGRIDGIFIHLHQVAEYMVLNNNMSDSLKVVKLPGPEFKIYPAFHKNLSPDLVNFLDQTFTKNCEEYLKLMKK